MKPSIIFLTLLFPMLGLSQCTIDTTKILKPKYIEVKAEIVESEEKEHTIAEKDKNQDKLNQQVPKTQQTIGGFLGFLLFEPSFLRPIDQPNHEQG